MVRALAERLKADGLRVWLDEWEIRAGDSIPSKIEEGLEGSRVLVLCMSAAAFGSDWATVESQTFRFRDPLNRERRFIPLRLDEAAVKGSLAQFLYVDWRAAAREREYGKLREACEGKRLEVAPEMEAARARLETRAMSLGHTGSVNAVAFSPDGRLALSGSADNTVRLWEVETGRQVRVLEGHSARVLSVAISGDGRLALSGSQDNTVRLWEVETGRQVRVLEGHSAGVWSVAFSTDGRQAFSSAVNGVLRIWDLTGTAGIVTEEQVEYANAKVLLVGDSGAGKTALSMQLAGQAYKETDSTVGAWATQLKLPVAAAKGREREIWLWDFGGQEDQRLIHQFYMAETALAVVMFDGQKSNMFDSLSQWDRDLARASAKPFPKLLAAGRVDASPIRVSRQEVAEFAKERGFHAQLFETSAKKGIGCEELKQAIVSGIDWDRFAWRNSPALWKRLREEIIQLKGAGRVLVRFNELRDYLQLKLSVKLEDRDLRGVVGLLNGPGVLMELQFGGWVLLQPELINAYGQAVIQTTRADQQQLGCIAEDQILRGELSYQSSIERLQDPEEERIILLTMVETLLERGLCLREHTEQGPLLVFPSFYGRERPDLDGHPAVLVSYRFDGFLDDVYATLVVRLHHTKAFNQEKLWRHAADFKTLSGKLMGVKVARGKEGAGELAVYFDPSIPVGEKIIFMRYVHEHLLGKARGVERERHYVCPYCGTAVENRKVAMRKLMDGKKDIPCIECEKRVPLWDELEELFGSEETRRRVLELQQASALVLSTASKERTLVGDVISTVSLADQIAREITVGDNGIDMEIQFRHDDGTASAKKLYLQLKSGDSHLRKRGDDVEVFAVKPRHARFWMEHEYPVMLVVRGSDGVVRWMEVRDWLIAATENGKKPVKQIEFDGERLDVMAVRRWRERVLLVKAQLMLDARK